MDLQAVHLVPYPLKGAGGGQLLLVLLLAIRGALLMFGLEASVGMMWRCGHTSSVIA